MCTHIYDICIRYLINIDRKFSCYLFSIYILNVNHFLAHTCLKSSNIAIKNLNYFIFWPKSDPSLTSSVPSFGDNIPSNFSVPLIQIILKFIDQTIRKIV